MRPYKGGGGDIKPPIMPPRCQLYPDVISLHTLSIQLQLWGIFGPITLPVKLRPDRASRIKIEEGSGVFYRFYNVNIVFGFIFTILALLLCNVLTNSIREKEFKRMRKLQTFMNRMRGDLRALNSGFGQNCDSKGIGLLIQQEVEGGPLRTYKCGMSYIGVGESLVKCFSARREIII